MRNLKKLLAVIVTIAMLASFAIPAFAEETTKSDSTICSELGVLKGDGSGVTADYLAKGTTRMQAATLYLRLIGKEDEAKAYTGTETFEDADLVNYADGKAILGYLKANPALGWIGGGENFDPLRKVTAQELYKVMLTALGYVQDTDFKYEDTITFAAEKGLKLKADDTDISNDDTATILVEALQATLKDGSKTLIADLVGKNVVTEAAATAVGLYSSKVTVTKIEGKGVRTILATFSAPVADATKLTLTLKRDTNVTVNFTIDSWNTAKTQATLKTSYDIQDGTYVLTAKYGDEAETTATATISASTVSKISFISQYGIISDSNGSSNTNDALALRTSLKFENQYGEDITSSINASDISVSMSKGSSWSWDEDSGILLIKDTTTVYAVGSPATVYVTVVYKSTGIVGSANLTVAQSAAAASIEFGEITSDDTSTYTLPMSMSSDFDYYYIPITVKDQYGNVLSAADISGYTYLSSNECIIKLGTVKKDSTTGGTVLYFADPTNTTANPQTYGTVVLTAVSANGVTATKTFTVNNIAQIDTFKFQSPADIVKGGVEIKIPFTAQDQYGNTLVSESDLPLESAATLNVYGSQVEFSDGTKVTVTGGDIKASVDYTNDSERTLYLKASTSASVVVLNVVTSKPAVDTKTFNVNDAPVPNAISGLSSSFYPAIQQGHYEDIDDSSSATNLDYISLIDQYGESVSLSDFISEGYSISIQQVTSNGKVSFSGCTFTATSGTSGTETFKAQLLDGATVIDEYSFTMTSVAKSDISNYAIDDITTKLYTGAVNDGIHTISYTIYGLKGTTKVCVPQNVISATTSIPGITVSNGVISTTSAVTSVDADTTGILNVLVEGSSTTYTISKKFTYNDDTPAAATLEATASDSVTSASSLTLAISSFASGVNLQNSADVVSFEILDQYGADLNTGNTFIISNKSFANASGAVNSAGTTITLSNVAAGDYFTLTCITTNGMTKSVKVYLTN